MKAADNFCGTSDAAKLLGLSVGTVQRLVESHELIAWKMQEGPRCISMQSLLYDQEAHHSTPMVLPHHAESLHVMVVDDDINTQKMYRAHFERWALPLDIVVYFSVIEAVLALPILKPLFLISELHMSDQNGFKFIKTIREHKLFSELTIIALTDLSSEVNKKEVGLAKDVLIFKKPIDMEWLKSFLEGVVTLKTDQVK